MNGSSEFHLNGTTPTAGTTDDASVTALAGDTLTRRLPQPGTSADAVHEGNTGAPFKYIGPGGSNGPNYKGGNDMFGRSPPAPLVTATAHVGAGAVAAPSPGSAAGSRGGQTIDLRPWYKRRRNWPTVVSLGMLATAMAALMVAGAVMFHANASLVAMAAYSLPATAATYLSLEARISHVDLDAGVGRLSIGKIVPHGDLAVSAESPFFKEQVEVFVNGNQFIFPAGLPGSQLDTTFSFTAGQSTEYPFDVHSTPIAIYAMTTASRTQLVQQMGGQPLRASPMLPITINLVGSLQSLVSDSSIDERLAAIGMINVQVFVSRSSLAKLYAVAMTVLMWMVAGSMALAVWNVMKYQREAAYYAMVVNVAMLMALPALRQAQPGIGSAGTSTDVFGFYWCMAMTVLSFVLLCGNAILSIVTTAPPGTTGAGAKPVVGK